MTSDAELDLDRLQKAAEAMTPGKRYSRYGGEPGHLYCSDAKRVIAEFPGEKSDACPVGDCRAAAAFDRETCLKLIALARRPRGPDDEGLAFKLEQAAHKADPTVEDWLAVAREARRLIGGEANDDAGLGWQDQPTDAGYYWWRANPGDHFPEIVHFESLMVTEMSGKEWPLHKHAGQWSGPIPIPTDSQPGGGHE